MDPANQVEQRIAAAGVQRTLATAAEWFDVYGFDRDEVWAWAEQFAQDRAEASAESPFVNELLSDESAIVSVLTLGYLLGWEERGDRERGGS